MNVSKDCIDIVKKNEGLRLTSYKCPAGIWTIGYGTTGPDIVRGMTITKEQAEEFLARDLNKFAKGVLAALEDKVPNQHEFDALVSLVYNIGQGNFNKSTVRKQFVKGNKIAAANAFMLFIKARDPKTKQLRVLPGLVARRTEEKNLFLRAESANKVRRVVSSRITASVPEASTVPEAPKPLSRSREIIGGAVVGVGSLGELMNSFSVNDLKDIKTGTQDFGTDASHSSFATQVHLPEVAASLTVILSLFIIWKRIADRNNGIR